ncbi:MAG: cation:proton antiporter [Myxococcota bacterium]
MGTVSVFLLCIAAIFLIGILGELVFARTGIPDVIWLIVVGIVLVPVAGLISKESLIVAAPYFGALTLVVVLFDGGSELKLAELSKAAGRGTLLAVLGFLIAVLFVAPVAMIASVMGILPDSWSWMHAVMLGTILGGSSSVVIMPALRKAGLAPRISNLVNLESALTDVLSVVSTGAVIQLLSAQHGEASGAGTAAVTLLKSFGIGVALGGITGLLSVLALRKLRKNQYAYPLTLGGLLILYVLIDELQGSAALGILTAAVILGNAPTLSKAIGLAKTARLGSNVKGVHGEMTFIIKSFFFCFIGAMLGPRAGQSAGNFAMLVAFGVFIGLVLFAARIPNVLAVTLKSGLSKPARSLVMVLFPRGMAAGVLAMMPHQYGIPGTRDLPVVVFSAVFTTILLFAVGFPILKKRLPEGDLEVDPKKKAKSDPAGASMTALPGRLERTSEPETATEAPAKPKSGVPTEDLGSAPTRELAAGIGGAADATTVDPNGPAAEAAIPLVSPEDS